MDYDDIYNPLSYDDKLLQDKLGYAYNNPYPKNLTMKDRINQKIMENEIINTQVKKELINREQTKEQVAAQTKEQVATQTKSCNCGCDGQKEGFVSTDLEIFSNKTLLFMIFILAAFCFIQYLNQQKMNNQLDNMMFLMYNTRNNSAVVHPASITPIATPATPATPAN